MLKAFEVLKEKRPKSDFNEYLREHDAPPKPKPLDFIHQEYMDSWHKLRSAATGGFGISRIPPNAVIDWMKFIGVPEDQKIFYYEVIYTIDCQAVQFKQKEDEDKQTMNKGGLK